MRIVWLLVAAILVVTVAGCGKFGRRATKSVDPGTKIGDVCDNPNDGAKMVWVPAGEFMMGSDNPKYPNENPPRKVHLDAYWIYKDEVTVAQYKKFCEETGREMPAAPAHGWIDNYPIGSVTWQDAVDYAEWAGGKLSTEAQWEKAARGVDGREFPWGNAWDPSKCTDGSKGSFKVQAIETYPADVSPYGCMDMAGNAIEWCADWYSPDYKGLTTRNPTGASDGEYRVIRGGAWHAKDPQLNHRCASRNPQTPDETSSRIGFRVVL